MLSVPLGMARPDASTVALSGASPKRDVEELRHAVSQGG